MNTNTKHTTKYKNSPLGFIPEDWEVKALAEEIEELQAGVSVNSIDETIRKEDKCILKTSSIIGGLFNENECKKITNNDIHRAKLNPKKDSILISRMNTPDLVGECGYVNDDYPNLFLPDRLWQTKFYETSQVNVKWLNYLLNTTEYKLKIKSSATGTSNSMKNISKNTFLSIRIPIPPNLEQTAIANCLSTWDKAIALQTQLITQKELAKKALMQQLLSGKKRLKGYSSEWKSFELNQICKINKGEQFNKIELNKVGEYPSFSGGIEPSGYTDKWNTDKDTIIISEGGNSCGYVNFITTKFWCGGHCYAMLNIKESFFKMFLFYSLKYNENKIMKLRVGSGLPNVQKKDLENFCLIIPSIEEQTAIANILQYADNELQLLKKKLEQLKEQKKGLMQVLLTGKKRLKY